MSTTPSSQRSTSRRATLRRSPLYSGLCLRELTLGALAMKPATSGQLPLIQTIVLGRKNHRCSRCTASRPVCQPQRNIVRRRMLACFVDMCGALTRTGEAGKLKSSPRDKTIAAAGPNGVRGSQMRAVVVSEYGGPEVLTPADLPEPEPQSQPKR